MFTKGHLADAENTLNFDQRRIEKMAERAAFSKCDKLLPTRRRFPAMVRITGYVICFISKCLNKVNRRKGTSKKFNGHLLSEATIWFSVFPVTVMVSDLETYKMQVRVHFGEKSEICRGRS